MFSIIVKSGSSHFDLFRTSSLNTIKLTLKRHYHVDKCEEMFSVPKDLL